MRTNLAWPFAVACLALAGAILPPFALRAQEEQAALQAARRCCEIHEEISSQGIPIQSVRFNGVSYELVFAPGCSQAQQAQAEQIKNEILGAPPVKIVVDNLQDALVVIQVEPGNESARRLLKKRYDELKVAAKKGQ